MEEQLQQIRQRWLRSSALEDEVALLNELLRRGMLSRDQLALAWRLQLAAAGALLETSPAEETEGEALRVALSEFAGLGPALLVEAAEAGVVSMLTARQVEAVRPALDLISNWLETRNKGLEQSALDLEVQVAAQKGALARVAEYLVAMVPACVHEDLGLAETLLLEVVAELDNELGVGLGGRGVRQFLLRKTLGYEVRMPEAWVFSPVGMNTNEALAIVRDDGAKAADQLKAWNTIVGQLSTEELLAACERSAALALRLWGQYSPSLEPLARALRASEQALERGEGLDLPTVLEDLEDAEAEANDDAEEGEPGAALAECAASIASSIVVFRSGLAVGKPRLNYAALSLRDTAKAGAEGLDLVERWVLARLKQPRST